MATPKAKFGIYAEDKTARAFKSVNASLGNVGKGFSKLTGIVSSLGLAVGGIGFGAMVASATRASSEIANLSTRLGGTVEQWSRLKYAAEQTDVSFQTMSTAMQRMQRRVAEAANGTGEAIDALNELGISAAKLKELAPTEQLYILADALQGVENQSDKVRIAMKLFDSEGVKLLQTLEGGSEALRALGDEGDKVGVTLSDLAVKRMGEFDKATKDVKQEAAAFANLLAAAVGPALADLAEWLGGNVPNAAQFTVDAFYKLRKVILEAVIDMGKKLAEFYGWLSVIPGKLGELFGEASAGWAQFAKDFENGNRELIDATYNVQEFVATTGQAVHNLDDFAGSNERASKATKKTTAAVKKLTEAEREFLALMKEGESLTESLRTPLEVYGDQLFRLNELLDEGAINYETYYRAIARYQEQLDKATTKTTEGVKKQKDVLKDAADEMGNVFSSALEDAIVNGASFSDILKGLEQDIIRIITRLLITEPLQNAIGGIFSSAGTSGSSGGIFSGLFSGIGDFFTGLFKAEGGPVRGGMPYIVGEQGPELFVPTSSGSIIPNGQMAGAGGITINMNVSTPDANSFRMSENQIGASAALAISRAQRNL